MGDKLFTRLVASPCCNPKLSFDELMPAYVSMGFRKYEVFTTWVQSAFDIDTDPRVYLDKSREFGLTYASLHLPPVDDADEQTLHRAVQGARFAAALGAPIVLYKAVSREAYIRTAGAFLDAIDDLAVTAVLQNQYRTPISSLDDFREVLEGIGDSRMKTLLEVGHFHSAGVDWRQGYELLGDTIRLVHVKDKVGRQSVVFGTGEIDYPALFAHMRDVGYAGDFVMEIEAGDKDNTFDMMRESLAYLEESCEEYL
ncbi:MAG: TIM barrel protein [Chitinivibrionales bacterium]|nr:TIM barrel protein [Chitinivibrionales bacterium]